MNAAARNALPDSSFAGPNRSYPVNDPGHAANAKARAKQQLDAGHITQAEYDAICAKANGVLSKSRHQQMASAMMGGR